MKLRRSLPAAIGMIGGFANIIWTGLIVLVMIIYLDFTGGRSDLGAISAIIFAILSAFVLRSSANYDRNKSNSKKTLIYTLLFILNSIIFGFLTARNIYEVMLFILILFGPGTFLLIPASYLQLKGLKE
jgi:hypothetical protein